MTKVTKKFRCHYIHNNNDGSIAAYMTALNDKGEPTETPGGSVVLHIKEGDEAQKAFEIDKKYTIDITSLDE